MAVGVRAAAEGEAAAVVQIQVALGAAAAIQRDHLQKARHSVRARARLAL